MLNGPLHWVRMTAPSSIRRQWTMHGNNGCSQPSTCRQWCQVWQGGTAGPYGSWVVCKGIQQRPMAVISSVMHYNKEKSLKEWNLMRCYTTRSWSTHSLLTKDVYYSEYEYTSQSEKHGIGASTPETLLDVAGSTCQFCDILTTNWTNDDIEHLCLTLTACAEHQNKLPMPASH